MATRISTSLIFILCFTTIFEFCKTLKKVVPREFEFFTLAIFKQIKKCSDGYKDLDALMIATQRI